MPRINNGMNIGIDMGHEIVGGTIDVDQLLSDAVARSISIPQQPLTATDFVYIPQQPRLSDICSGKVERGDLAKVSLTYDDDEMRKVFHCIESQMDDISFYGLKPYMVTIDLDTYKQICAQQRSIDMNRLFGLQVNVMPCPYPVVTVSPYDELINEKILRDLREDSFNRFWWK